MALIKGQFKVAMTKDNTGNVKTKTIKYLDCDGVEQEGIYFEAYASTKDIDRGNDVVLPDSFTNLDDYLEKNNILLVGHDYGQYAGNIITAVPDDYGLYVAGIVKVDVNGNNIQKAVRCGVIQTLSIGYGINTDDIVVKETEDGQVYYELKSLELYEISLVAVPMQANATFKNMPFGKLLTKSSIQKLTDDEFKANFKTEEGLQPYSFIQSINDTMLKIKKELYEKALRKAQRDQYFKNYSEELQEKLVKQNLVQMGETVDDSVSLAEQVEGMTQEKEGGEEAPTPKTEEKEGGEEGKEPNGEGEELTGEEKSGEEEEGKEPNGEEKEVETNEEGKKLLDTSKVEGLETKDVDVSTLTTGDKIRYKYTKIYDDGRKRSYVNNAEVLMVKSKGVTGEREATKENPIVFLDVYDLDIDGYKSTGHVEVRNVDEIQMVNIKESQLKEYIEAEKKEVGTLTKSQKDAGGGDTPLPENGVKSIKSIETEGKTVDEIFASYKEVGESLEGGFKSLQEKVEELSSKEFISKKEFEAFTKTFNDEATELLTGVKSALERDTKGQSLLMGEIRQGVKFVSEAMVAMKKITFSKGYNGSSAEEEAKSTTRVGEKLMELGIGK